MTADVTHLPLQVDHYPSCDRDVYGRAVLALMDIHADAVTARNMRTYVAAWREGASCPCLGFRISTVETDLARAEKRFKACMSEGNAERVAVLKAERDRLRGMA